MASDAAAVPESASVPLAAPASASNDAIQPVLFLTHGAGPCFYMEGGMFADIDKHSPSAQFFRDLVKSQNLLPRAIVVISAHWDTTDTIEINGKASANDRHTLYYDYGGFPADTYKLQWPVPGEPQLATRIANLLRDKGFSTRNNTKRGLDHGVFVPLLLAFPNADIPVVEVSMLSSLDPDEHLRLGEALQPLRKEGVLIVASGSTTHGFDRSERAARGAKEFSEWVDSTCTQVTGKERFEALRNFQKAPGVSFAHPNPDHLLPLMVAAGAAGDSKGVRLFSYAAMRGLLVLSHFRFG